jgi:hypothetical protein
MIEEPKKVVAKGGLANLLISMIDKDHDGSIIDDMMQMAMKSFA